MTKSIDSPQFRRQRGRLGAYTWWARTENRTSHSLPARRALVDKLENEVDFEGRLTIQERGKRAEYGRNAHMQRMALKAVQVARGRH